MLGVRDYEWDADMAFSGKMREISEPISQAKRNLASARYQLEDNKITAQEFESQYQAANEARRQQMDIIRQHYRNMSLEPWAYSEGEKIKLLKESGVSSMGILDVITNRYTDLPKVRSLSTSEIYEELDQTDPLGEINDIAKTDPSAAKKLLNYHKRLKNIEKRNLSEKDKLILGLDADKRIDYLQSIGAHRSQAVLREYQKKGIATPDVIRGLRLKGGE